MSSNRNNAGVIFQTVYEHRHTQLERLTLSTRTLVIMLHHKKPSSSLIFHLTFYVHQSSHTRATSQTRELYLLPSYIHMIQFHLCGQKHPLLTGFKLNASTESKRYIVRSSTNQLLYLTETSRTGSYVPGHHQSVAFHSSMSAWKARSLV